MHPVSMRFVSGATEEERKRFLNAIRGYAPDALLVQDEHADGPVLNVESSGPEGALDRAGEVVRGVLEITRQPSGFVELSVGLGFN